MDHHQEQKLWFKAKRYGYGWYPSTWQGWAILLMYVFAIVSDVVVANNHSHSVSDFLMSFFPRLYILTVFLIVICEAKGEPGKWRWGTDKHETLTK